MAILSPADLPTVCKMRTEPMKKYVLSKMGYPQVNVEISEDQWETIWRVAGDFIAGYFPREQRLAVFWTSPLKSTYPMPSDAYWIQDVKFDSILRIDDIFGAEAYLFNVGNFNTGAMNILTDYHLIQAYRKTASKIMGYESHFEVINEVDGDSTQQLIRLYPTPKGAYPVVVLYIPVINVFRSPQAKMLAYEMMLAEAKIAVGSARSKVSGMPTPDGGSITLDGADMVKSGEESRGKLIEQAILLGEPMTISLW